MGSRLFWFTTNHRLLETMVLLMTHHYKSDSVLQPNKGGTNITLVCGLIKVKFITDWRLLSVTPANATVYNLHTHLEEEQVLIHYLALCSLRNFKVFVLILHFFLICKMLHSVWYILFDTFAPGQCSVFVSFSESQIHKHHSRDHKFYWCLCHHSYPGLWTLVGCRCSDIQVQNPSWGSVSFKFKVGTYIYVYVFGNAAQPGCSYSGRCNVSVICYQWW